MEKTVDVVKIDERAKTTTFTFMECFERKEILATCIMQDFFHVVWWNKNVRDKVLARINKNGSHYVWSAEDKNIHYLIKDVA